MGYSEKELFEAALDSYNDLQPGQELENHDGWRVINVFNDEDKDGAGLYACAIETKEGDLIFSFRGTNSFSDLALTDLDMIDSEEIEMQKAAREYVHYVIGEIKKKGKDYNHIIFTGHSLGGNLAEHAAITAPEEIREKCEAISYDGPGYSQKYIDAHKDEIKGMNGKLHRFQWSFVGGLLCQLDEENYESVHTDSIDIPLSFSGGIPVLIPETVAVNAIYDALSNVFWKHINYDMIRNNCDENGNLRRGSKEAFAKDLQAATVFLDFIQRIKSFIPGNTANIVDLYKLYVKKKNQENKGNRKRPQESAWARENTEFYVDIKQIQNNMGKMEELYGAIRTYMEEVETIRKNTVSIKGLWVEKNLMKVYQEIENSIDKLYRLKSTGVKCIQIYDEREEAILNYIS